MTAFRIPGPLSPESRGKYMGVNLTIHFPCGFGEANIGPKVWMAITAAGGR